MAFFINKHQCSTNTSWASGFQIAYHRSDQTETLTCTKKQIQNTSIWWASGFQITYQLHKYLDQYNQTPCSYKILPTLTTLKEPSNLYHLNACFQFAILSVVANFQCCFPKSNPNYHNFMKKWASFHTWSLIIVGKTIDHYKYI